MCNSPDNNAGTVYKYTVLDKCWTNSTLWLHFRIKVQSSKLKLT